MIDENAFGILVAYYDVEEDEYALSREEFVARFEGFRECLRRVLREHRLGTDVRAVDLGHAFYIEVGDGDQSESPLAWAKRARGDVASGGYETLVAVTHGSRWVDEAESSFVSTEHLGDAGVVTLSNPSEPLRRALLAEARGRRDDDDDAADGANSAWGPGVYLDTEAAEALGLAPKNAPTVLRAAGASFYRAGR